jgi:prevent-host-death family protein
MSVTNTHAAKTNLSKLVEAALSGEEVIIAKAGQPAVKLVPVENAPAVDRERFFGALKGKLTFDADEWTRMDEAIEALFNDAAILPNDAAS